MWVKCVAAALFIAQARATAGGVAQQYEQCGGQLFTGPTRCATGLACKQTDEYYSQCLLSTGDGGATVAQQYEQCGGSDWSGPTECTDSLTCVRQDEYYSQCLRNGRSGAPGDNGASADEPSSDADVPDPGGMAPSSAGSSGTFDPNLTLQACMEQGATEAPRITRGLPNDAVCGCPANPCCDDDACIDGATCVPFEGIDEELSYDYDYSYSDYDCKQEGGGADCDRQRFQENVYTPVPGKRCVLNEGLDVSACGAVNGTCCFTEGPYASFEDGGCDGTETRLGYCASNNYFLSGDRAAAPKPICVVGRARPERTPGCEAGEEPIDGDEGEGLCCEDGSCPGRRVCKEENFNIRAAVPPWTIRPLFDVCASCEDRVDSPCGPATDNNVQCCADLFTGGPGFPERILHCVAPDGSATGNTTCQPCGKPFGTCCNDSIKGTAAAGISGDDGCAQNVTAPFQPGGQPEGNSVCRNGTCVVVCEAGTGDDCA